MRKTNSHSRIKPDRERDEHGLPVLRPGQRVRLRPPLLEVELRSPLGTVARVGDYAGYYVIRLDEPARYFPLGQATGGESEEITELVESADNLDVWQDGRWCEPDWVNELDAAEGLAAP